jgi:hypothetical protein
MSIRRQAVLGVRVPDRRIVAGDGVLSFSGIGLILPRQPGLGQ